MNKTILKNIGIYAGILLLFIVAAYSFTPQVLDGKIVNQGDIASWKGMANEAVTHNAAHPEDPTAWTNSMFGGMPTTATIDDFEGDWTDAIYDFLLTGRRPASYLLIALIGGFLLMLSLGTRKAVAVAGAIAMAFCSYNMQIIQVGHNTKMQAIAYFPWVLAGVVWTYRMALRSFAGAQNDRKGALNDKPNVMLNKEKHLANDWKLWLPKTLLGATLFAFALSFQIKANHPQITYYLAITVFAYAIGVFVYLCKNAERRAQLKRFFIASALLLVIGCVGIATNANKLIPTMEYSKFTMRGGSELASDDKNHNDKGLNLEYATAWSYGIEEMPNLLIPNFNGGASAGELPLDSETGKLLKKYGQPNLRQTMKHLPLYWGPQPFTAGPMYMGAISIFLFVLGLILCKGREKWWLVAATVVSIFLAWGNHFMWFTRLWFDYAPMYNKFRTVSMALIVLQITLPMLGFYVLDRILKGKYEVQKLTKASFISFGITAGFCLLCVLMPGIAGTFTGSSDAGMQEMIVDALAADRATLLKKDAFRSIVFISCVLALILWAFRKANTEEMKGLTRKTTIVAVAVIALVWIDLAGVGKRYLNKEHFVTPKDFSAHYEPRIVDEIIHQDEDPNYRILDLSVNTFNDAIQSYHHKCIGGYSPVKLQRYQDLIDRYITSEIREFYTSASDAETIGDIEDNLPELKVVSMLNGKYIIVDPACSPVQNPFAYGNCWFVEDYVPASDPNEEIALLASTDLNTTAVIGKDFEWAMESFADAQGDKAGIQDDKDGAQDGQNCHPEQSEGSPNSISLTHYAPNELRYTFKTDEETPAIFSEIYYPKGWKAWIEPAGAYGKVSGGHYIPTDAAKQIDLFRANWMLRGAIIPEGEGTLIMRFEPESYALGANISRACSILLILLMLASAAGAAMVEKKVGKPA